MSLACPQTTCPRIKSWMKQWRKREHTQCLGQTCVFLWPVAGAFCGVIYFTVALFDLRNGNGVVHHGGQFCFHQQNIISRSRQNRNIHNRVTRKQLNSYIWMYNTNMQKEVLDIVCHTINKASDVLKQNITKHTLQQIIHYIKQNVI